MQIALPACKFHQLATVAISTPVSKICLLPKNVKSSRATSCKIRHIGYFVTVYSCYIQIWLFYPNVLVCPSFQFLFTINFKRISAKYHIYILCSIRVELCMKVTISFWPGYKLFCRIHFPLNTQEVTFLSFCFSIPFTTGGNIFIIGTHLKIIYFILIRLWCS